MTLRETVLTALISGGLVACGVLVVAAVVSIASWLIAWLVVWVTYA